MILMAQTSEVVVETKIYISRIRFKVEVKKFLTANILCDLRKRKESSMTQVLASATGWSVVLYSEMEQIWGDKRLKKKYKSSVWDMLTLK